MDLDSFDLQILSCLDIDARQSYLDIGKKINRSKQFVSYRVQKLIEDKIIVRFITDINLRKMGYTIFNIFLQLQKLSDKDEEKIFSFLNNSKHVGFCFKTLGNWDLFLSVKSESVQDFYSFLGDFHNFFSKYIKKESVNLEMDSFSTNLRFLNNNPHKCADLALISSTYPERRKLGVGEEAIINCLREDPLISYSDLSIKVKKSNDTLKKSIKKLSDEKIINHARAIISTEILGFERYLFLIELSYIANKQKEIILSYLRKQRNIDYIIECIGSWNIICNVYSKNTRELVEIINSFKNEFSSISSIEFLRIIQFEKEVFKL
jgi:Lrp/AsnC family transcriptional regulator, leucine-responsive regulatory protein